jgi:hypothetical protein
MLRRTTASRRPTALHPVVGSGELAGQRDVSRTTDWAARLSPVATPVTPRVLSMH